MKLAGLRCVASILGSLLVAGHEAALSQEMEQFEQVIATWKWTSLLFTYVLHDLDVFALARAAVDGGTAG